MSRRSGTQVGSSHFTVVGPTQGGVSLSRRRNVGTLPEKGAPVTLPSCHRSSLPRSIRTIMDGVVVYLNIHIPLLYNTHTVDRYFIMSIGRVIPSRIVYLNLCCKISAIDLIPVSDINLEDGYSKFI